MSSEGMVKKKIHLFSISMVFNEWNDRKVPSCERHSHLESMIGLSASQTNGNTVICMTAIF